MTPYLSNRCRGKQSDLVPRGLFLFLVFLCCDLPAQNQLPPVQWLGPPGGDIRSVALLPEKPEILFAGTDEGGLYKSSNGGQSWERLETGLEEEEAVVQRIVTDSRFPGSLWVVAWLRRSSGGIVLYSGDAGSTWTELFHRQEGAGVRDLLLSPGNPSRWHLVTLEGILRSEDRGASWGLLEGSGSLDNGVKTMWFDPNQPERLLAGTRRLLYASTDGGQNWELTSKGINPDSDVFRVLSLDSSGKTILLTACSGIYRSTDGGESWRRTLLNQKGNFQWMSRRVISLGASADGSVLYAGSSSGLYRSVDAGKSWTFCFGDKKIIHDIVVHPSDKKVIFLAVEDDGVVKSDDGGISFQPSNKGIIHHRISAISSDVWKPAEITIGMPDDYREGGAYTTRDHGQNWSKEKLNPSEVPEEVFALLRLSSPREATLAGTSDGLFLREEAGEAWRKLPSAQVRGRINALFYAPIRSYGLVLAAGQEGLFLSEDGLNWRLEPFQTGSEGNSPIFSLASTSQGKIYLLAGAMGRVQVSEDLGKTWRISRQGLPEVPVQSMVCPFEDAGPWLLGTRLGIFRSTDRGETWERVSDDLGGVDAALMACFPLPSAGRGQERKGEVVSVLLATDNYTDGLVYSTDQGASWHRYPGWKIKLCSLWIKPEPQGVLLGGTASDGLFSLSLKEFMARLTLSLPAVENHGEKVRLP